MDFCRKILLAAVILFLPFPCIVAGNGREVPEADVLMQRWSRYNQAGQYDSVIVSAGKVLDFALRSGDKNMALVPSVMIAQAYMFTERADSALSWIRKVESLGIEEGSLRVRSVFYNTRALYAVKFKLDYSEALKYFFRGYEVATALDNQDYRVAFLTNIVNVYYLRSDDGGLSYATDALRIVDSCDVSEFSRCLSYLAMSQMCYVRSDYESAKEWVERTDSLVHQGEYGSLIASVELLYGDVCSAFGSFSQAEKHYGIALEHSYNTEPGVISRIYLNYGKCYQLRGKTEEAVNLYTQGLEVSNKHGNVEFRLELLRRLTDIYSDRGDLQKLQYYYRQLRESLDTIAGREREFNSLLLSNQRMRHELELSTNELELMKARRRNMLWMFISLIAILLVASLFFLWRRQKRMYRILVDQHVHFVQQLEMLQAGVSQTGDNASDDKDSAYKQLFSRLESLMSKDKVFRKKDLTLDRLAEMTDSNRTYVSKAINHCAGQSFSSWLNMYRIAEATRLISRQGWEMPLKQIADDVGYVSMSVFYNAFCKETGLPPGRYRKEIQNRKNVPDS